MQVFPTDLNWILQQIDSINPEVYSKTRNFTNGAVTYLSPYISRGIISTKQVKDAIANRGFSFQQSEKLIQELAWREYYQRVWQVKAEQVEQDLLHPQTGMIHKKLPQALHDAHTGIEAIDAAIRQLYSSGYIHNHLRMYIASITCNIAKAYWKQPARWFYYHLLDGDLASNHCSWQWVAGTFSSKKYYCNQENINKYTGTFQTGSFLDQSYDVLPQLSVPNSLQLTVDLELSTPLPQTPLPSIDPVLPTLIYNGYNLDPLWRKNEPVNRILLLEPSHFNKYPVSEKVIEFIIKCSQNIPGIQLYCGEFDDLKAIYKDRQQTDFIFKEHPAFRHYEGRQDQRTWMFPEVQDYYPSFFKYWNKCRRYL